jgi:hypothetical protein
MTSGTTPSGTTPAGIAPSGTTLLELRPLAPSGTMTSRTTPLQLRPLQLRPLELRPLQLRPLELRRWNYATETMPSGTTPLELTEGYGTLFCFQRLTRTSYQMPSCGKGSLPAANRILREDRLLMEVSSEPDGEKVIKRRSCVKHDHVLITHARPKS